MTTYARWPKSIWYVYDVRGQLIIMSLKHVDDVPVSMSKEEAAAVDIEYVVSRFPDLDDAEIDELLGYVNVFEATKDPEPVAEPEPEKAAEPQEPVKKTRKPRKPSAAAVAADAKLVVVVDAIEGVNGNRDEFPEAVVEVPRAVEHVDIPVHRELTPMPEPPVTAVPVNIDLMPEW